MAGKCLGPTALTVTAGAVLAFGISTAASAATLTTVTGLSAPAVQPVPYPPRPAEQVNTVAQDQVNTIDQNQKQGNHIRLENRRRHHRNCAEGCRNCGGNCGGGGCGRSCGPRAVAGKQLPFTGAPMETMAALGGGLLAVGATGTLISVRRRRSASAE
ncbi:hypothetical protein ABZU75_36895 [Streptosporangium sp. NPDC005286]|uniref:hypothetical protein n=1 Tax=Streptosporangium sp. NPDC005286 TaxID=3154463 RepID=UPI0033B1CE0F